MKKRFFVWIILAALMLSLTACGSAPAAEPQTEAPAAEPQTEAPSAEPQTETARQDGERFESVIMIEGMEEPVQYEHIRRETLGFAMDYDYENFVRSSEADCERFVSNWDDPAQPENYLEVRYDTGNAELVRTAIAAALSNEYDVMEEEYSLDGAGSCVRLDASCVKGSNMMAERLQEVYIIPAGSGCVVGTAHFFIEGAEGYGRRFACMMNTLTVLERDDDREVSDDMALSAIRSYCCDNIPDLESFLNSEESVVYWDIASSDEQQVVVVFQSYTGAQNRFYIDRATGDTTVTEFVPGITEEERPTGETLNVWDYMG